VVDAALDHHVETAPRRGIGQVKHQLAVVEQRYLDSPLPERLQQ